MPMTKHSIRRAIEDRLCFRWRNRCQAEDAAPIAVVAVKQLAGPGFGTPVLCTTEDMDQNMLADMLEGIARQLRAMPGGS